MDIFSVLIVIAVMAIAIFKQYNKGTAASRPVKKQVAVPPSSFVEEEEKTVPAKKPQVRMQRSAFREEKKPEAPHSVSEPKREKEEGVSLRTTADARRAFIYSEIFKRKYD